MLFSALALASLAFSAQAQTVHNVVVGGPGLLAYTPNIVNANIGDQIIFTFKQKNHTVTQSTFSNPCSAAPGGFDSGFMPVADDVTDNFPTTNVTVNSVDPIWLYCKQANHCQQGMVFAVNPGDKFAAFQAAANASGSSGTATSPAATSTAASVVTVTATVTEGSNVWTTTYGSFPGSAEPTSAAPQDHKIVVGGTNKLTFDPANITAQPGDTITFQFMVKNHTATQSSFSAPCVPLGVSSNTPGFDSGFKPVAANATDFPTFTVSVNDTKPIWVYCAQSGHCGQGMVFAANAIESGPNNFAAFQALAMKVNGTGSSSTSTASGAGSSSTSSGVRNIQQGAGVLLALSGLILALTL